MRFIDIANTFHEDRNSRPKLFCKNDVFQKIHKIHNKAAVSESRFENSTPR